MSESTAELTEAPVAQPKLEKPSTQVNHTVLDTLQVDKTITRKWPLEHVGKPKLKDTDLRDDIFYDSENAAFTYEEVLDKDGNQVLDDDGDAMLRKVYP